MRPLRRSSLLEFGERYALLVLAVAIFLFFTLDPATSEFASGANLKNILTTQSVLGILVIGTMVPLIAGHIDLSVGPAGGLCSLLCAGMMSKAGWPLVPSIIVTVLAGLAIGAVNGALVARLGINSIVATLGTSSMIAALVTWYSGGNSISNGLSPALTALGAGDWLGLPKPFWFLLATAVIAYYVLGHTPIGRNLYSAGSSPRAAELVGLPVGRMTAGGFLTSGTLAGVAGVVLVGQQGGGNPLLGTNYTLPALAAVFLGATVISPGKYNVPGAMIALFLVAIGVDGLTLLGAADWVSDMFNGVALVVGVGIATYSGRRRRTRPMRSVVPPDAQGPPATDLAQPLVTAAMSDVDDNVV